MSKKIKLEIKEEQEAIEERIRSERIDTSDVVTKPEVKDENDEEQVVRIENPVSESVLYCIGDETFLPAGARGRYNHEPGRSISYMSGSLTTPLWTTIDWPHPRLYPGTVIHDHKLYIIGGNEGFINQGPHEHTITYFGRMTYLDTIEVFDLRTKSWLPVRQLPVKMARMRLCSLGDYIYIGGGIRKQGEATAHGGLFRYCPISGQFEEKQTPTGKLQRHKSAMLALNGCLYALACADNNNLSIERYDPAADQWSLLQPNTNYYRTASDMLATVHRGKIYVLTDKHGLEVFCPDAGSWTRLGDTPDRQGNKKVVGVLASYDNRLVSVGNMSCEPHFRVFEFDFETAVWIRRADGDTPQNRFALQVYNPSG